jgi:spermidine/putrescine transport system ATP-binding protein
VELCGVSRFFASGAAAVDSLSLQIGQGEFFTILGPSGCGKTTTLRLIAGFEQPDKGEVRIQGQAMSRLPPWKRPVNTVFQNYALFPHLTVAENVAYGLVIKKVPQPERGRRVAEALALVRLNGMEQRRPSEMSGGQQQRAALARALVNRPAVLLLDEPLGALDLKLRKQMQQELKQLQTQLGITFVYVTHDQEEALAMSDRIAVMQAGRVLQVDAPAVIYERPASRFVADFIGETNFLAGQVLACYGGSVAVSVAGGELCLAQREGDWRTGQTVLLAVRPERLKITAAPAAIQPGLAAFFGTVESCMFIGTDTRCLVRLRSGETITVRLQNDRAGQTWAAGTAVTVCCWTADLRLLQL